MVCATASLIAFGVNAPGAVVLAVVMNSIGGIITNVVYGSQMFGAIAAMVGGIGFLASTATVTYGLCFAGATLPDQFD